MILFFVLYFFHHSHIANDTRDSAYKANPLPLSKYQLKTYSNQKTNRVCVCLYVCMCVPVSADKPKK